MRALTLLALGLFGASASAQDLSIYTGVAIGAFDHDEPMGGAFSDTVSSWKVYGGVQLGDHFGFEAGRGSTSELDGGVSGSPLSVDVRRFPVAYGVDFAVTTVKAMGYLPFDWGAVWIGYGGFVMDADVEYLSESNDRRSLSVDDEGEMAALGIEWRRTRLDRSVDVRVEYEWLDFPFADASTVSVGVAYRWIGL